MSHSYCFENSNINTTKRVSGPFCQQRYGGCLQVYCQLWPRKLWPPAGFSKNVKNRKTGVSKHKKNITNPNVEWKIVWHYSIPK